MYRFHLAAIFAASLAASSPALAQSAVTPYVNGTAVTPANPLPVVQTQPPPAVVFAMPAPPQLSRWQAGLHVLQAKSINGAFELN